MIVLNSIKILFITFLSLILSVQGQSITLSSLNISWNNRGFQTDFIISSNGLVASNAWISFGFGSQMNSANVIICKSKTNGSSIEHYYNSNYNSALLVSNNPSIGITNVNVQVLNGNLYCSFTRDNSNLEPNYFKINSKTNSFLIAAYGLITSSGKLSFHSLKEVSSKSVSFMEATTTLKPSSTNLTSKLSTSSTKLNSNSTKRTSMSTTKSTTISIPVLNSSITLANVKIAWSNRGSQTDFILSSSLDSGLKFSNAWVGFGFNNRMNPTNVIICKSKTTGSSIEHYYNNNFHTSKLVSSNPTIGIANAKVQILNGKIFCSFTRNNTNSANNYFKITSQTKSYLIAAFGPLSFNGDVSIHSDADASKVKISF